MNISPTMKILLLLLAAALGSYGTSMATGVVSWPQVTGGVASALASAIVGLFVNMPKREWSEEERANKLGEKP